MKKQEQQKLKQLIKKYNSVLKESMACMLAEDLFNLIIVNGDDKDFELNNLLTEKEELKTFVLKEFILLNNKPITAELKNMEEISFRKKTEKQGMLKF